MWQRVSYLFAYVRKRTTVYEVAIFFMDDSQILINKDSSTIAERKITTYKKNMYFSFFGF